MAAIAVDGADWAYADDVGSSGAGSLCGRCMTTLELLEIGDPFVEGEPEAAYVLCADCVNDGVERSGSGPGLDDFQPALDELCSCEDCWPEVERAWEDGENRSAGPTQADAGDRSWAPS